jgi:ABC-type transport system involved in cytochrome bd biosynthesis fused ATPase/permease subunit
MLQISSSNFIHEMVCFLLHVVLRPMFMQECVMTALAEKTVVLVTHQVEFLTETDRILVS